MISIFISSRSWDANGWTKHDSKNGARGVSRSLWSSWPSRSSWTPAHWCMTQRRVRGECPPGPHCTTQPECWEKVVLYRVSCECHWRRQFCLWRKHLWPLSPKTRIDFFPNHRIVCLQSHFKSRKLSANKTYNASLFDWESEVQWSPYLRDLSHSTLSEF